METSLLKWELLRFLVDEELWLKGAGKKEVVEFLF